jgi:hypothetical protein
MNPHLPLSPPPKEEEEEVAYSGPQVPQLGKQMMSSKRKSFTAFLSGDLTGRVTPVVAPHMEKNDLARYLGLPQELDKDVYV